MTPWSPTGAVWRTSLVRLLWLLAATSVYVTASLPPGRRFVPYLAAHAVMTAAMFALWLRARALTPEEASREVRASVMVGVVARVALVFAPSFTTTDVGRYLWDGAVALDGHDPYALAPMADALAGLRERFPLPFDHHDVATCYPPLALALFTLCAAAGSAHAFVAWKALTALASSLTAVALWRHLGDTERRADVTLAALSPLLVLESGVGAHLDTLTTLAVAVALIAAERGRWNVAALAVGCAGALKLTPGLVVLPLVARAPRKVWFLALSAAPLAWSMAAAEALGMTAPGSLPVVAVHWSFASPVWSALYHFFPYDDDVTRPALALAGLCLIVAASLRRGAVARNARDATGAWMAVSPVLYPWYGAPLAALTALAPSAWSLAVVSALPCSYEVLDAWHSAGRWTPSQWPMLVVAVAFGAGVAWDVRARGRR